MLSVWAELKFILKLLFLIVYFIILRQTSKCTQIFIFVLLVQDAYYYGLHFTFLSDFCKNGSASDERPKKQKANKSYFFSVANLWNWYKEEEEDTVAKIYLNFKLVQIN